MSDVRLDNGVMTITGKRGAIVVSATRVRMITATRRLDQPDASLCWVTLAYENDNGVIQHLTLDCGGSSEADHVVDTVARYSREEMGKDYDA